MHHFNYLNNILHCEEVSIPALAEQVGTPFYLYSTATLTTHFKVFDQAFDDVPHLICFAVKSCPNLAVLNLLAKLGGGMDIVSGGELYRALRVGVAPAKIVYSGVGKTDEEMRYALKSNILMFNVESGQELSRLAEVAASFDMKAPVSLRVNPDVDPVTHPYISTGLAKNKFGIPIAQAAALYAEAQHMPNIEVLGVSCHIGSQLTMISPFVESLIKLKDFVKSLRKNGIAVSYLDLGGGLGIQYDAEEPPHPREYGAAIQQGMKGLDCTLILEPGRVIAGNGGVLVTKVLYTKSGAKKFIIVDAAMNDLARPSLYNAFHAIEPVVLAERAKEVVDVVGPVCETGDFLVRDQELLSSEPGELLAVMSAGAYGFSMSSNYNSRPRAAEVLVDGTEYRVVRARESFSDLIRGESV